MLPAVSDCSDIDHFPLRGWVLTVGTTYSSFFFFFFFYEPLSIAGVVWAVMVTNAGEFPLEPWFL